MENIGYIKLFRKLKNKKHYRQENYVRIWVHLLLSACYEDKEFVWNGEAIKIKAGQLLTGRKAISQDLNIPETTVSNWLELLEKERKIGQYKTTRYRIITIYNWAKYQGSVEVDAKWLQNGFENSKSGHQEILKNGSNNGDNNGNNNEVDIKTPKVASKWLQNGHIQEVKKKRNIASSKKEDLIHKNITILFSYYKELYIKWISDEAPIFLWGHCEKLARPHMKSLGLDKMKKLLTFYLKYAKEDDLKFFEKSSFSLQTFLSASVLNKLNTFYGKK